MRISDWSSDVCSSDLAEAEELVAGVDRPVPVPRAARHEDVDAAERRALQPLLRRVAVERTVAPDRDHRWSDLGAPPGRLAVDVRVEQRVVVDVAASEVPQGVVARLGEVLTSNRRVEEHEHRLRARDTITPDRAYRKNEE